MIVSDSMLTYFFLNLTITSGSVPSKGLLVGNPAGHPDSVCPDGLHRPPVRPHYGTLWPGLTLDQICFGEFVQHGSDTAGGKTDRRTADSRQWTTKRIGLLQIPRGHIERMHCLRRHGRKQVTHSVSVDVPCVCHCIAPRLPRMCCGKLGGLNAIKGHSTPPSHRTGSIFF